MAVFNLRRALADGFASSLVGIVPAGKEPVGIAVSADRAHKWLYVKVWSPPGTISVVNMHLAEIDPQKALLAEHHRRGIAHDKPAARTSHRVACGDTLAASPVVPG